MGISNFLDGLNMTINRELETELTIQQRVDIILVIAHDLTQNHILKTVDGPGIISAHQGLKGLIKVRICGLVVLIVGIQHSGHEINFGQNRWLAVDIIGIGP